MLISTQYYNIKLLINLVRNITIYFSSVHDCLSRLKKISARAAVCRIGNKFYIYINNFRPQLMNSLTIRK